MNTNKVQNTHYLRLSYNSLITNKVIHYFLFLVDVALIFLQILEIYHNQYKSLKENDTKHISFITLLIKELDKLKIGIKFIIYIIILLIEIVCTLVLNNFNLQKNKFWNVIINLTEIFFHRIGVLFMFYFLFSFNDVYLVTGIILTLPYLIMIISCFNANHLFYFFVKLIRYPYDSFSKMIDINLLFIKIFLAISGMSSGINLSKFFFILSLIMLLFLQIYLTYIKFKKSYYIMNNVSLNKIRYTILLSNCIIILLALIVQNKYISNIYLLICYANVLILSILLIYIFYDPYHYIKFGTDDNEENVYFYFFVLDRNKNNNLLLEMKIEEHKNKCGRCNLCKKYVAARTIEKFENIDLYYIIYDNKNKVLDLMTKIIRELRKQENSLSNNYYFLINLTYIYCTAINQNDYCFFLNTELFFSLLNSDNTQYLEEHKLYLNRVKYTNNFIMKANEIIETFYKLFDEKNLEKKYEIMFNFEVLLGELKYKEIKNSNNNNNYYNNNANNIDKNLNCNNLLTICSIFYEELYNESISNSRIYIRDSQNILEDLINNNYKNQKLITVEINAMNFQVKIIRAGGYMNKYENTYLFELFPEIFKAKQIYSMKYTLLNSNSDNKKIIKTNKTNARIKNKVFDNQYLNFSFLIEEKDENNIYYKLLKLEMNLVSLKDIKTIIYLNGIYKIDKDIIITEQRKNIEYLLHLGNKGQENIIEGISKDNKVIIKYRHGNKYLGNKKLVQDENSLKGCKHYKVYHFLLPSKKNIYSRTNFNDLDNLTNEYNNEKMNNSDKSDNLFFNDVASQSSSVASSISKNNLMLNNRGNKQSQDGEDVSKGIINSKYLLWIGIFIMLIAFIIEYIILKLYNSNLRFKINFYLHITRYSLIFNRIFISILSLSCVAKSPNTTECVNHIDYFSKNAIATLNYLITAVGASKEDYFLDFQELLFNQEQILSTMFEDVTNQITNDLAEINDNEIKQYFEENIIHYKINQNFEDDILNLSIKKENISFTDAILLYTSRCSILSKDKYNLLYPIYILNKIDNENMFQNVNKNKKLNTYQENFYLLLLDDGKLFVHLIDIIYKLESLIKQTSTNFKTFVLFVMGLNAFLYIIIFFLLFWYINIHLFIIFKILRNIYSFLNEKLGEISVKDIMRKKIDNLKLILLFYDNDINSTINELNAIYSNYKENYNLKLKEENKQMKKEIKNEKDTQKKDSFLDIFKLKNFNLFFTYSTKRTIYKYSILITIIFIVILFVIYIIAWVFFFIKESSASNWLSLSRELSKSTNDLMANFLIMIYTNQTFQDVSSHLETGDFTSYIYEKLTELYNAGGYVSEIKDFIIFNQDTMNHTCKEFYETLQNDFFKQIVAKYESLNSINQLYQTLEFFCEVSNILTFKNYKTAYMQLFNPIENIMQSFKADNYTYIVEFIEENNVPGLEIFFFITYIYLLDLMNGNIQNVYISLVDYIDNRLDIMGIIFVIAFIHLVLSVFLIFSRNMDKDCQHFIQMRKIFKVYNINE